MSPLIDEILTEMKAEFGITKFELEKIIDSQFKVLQNNIEERSLKEVHFKYLGKFKPTTFLIAYKDGRVKKQDRGNSGRVEEPLNQS